MATTLDPKKYSKLLHARKTDSSRERFRKKYNPKKGGSEGKGKRASDPFTPQIKAAEELRFGPQTRELQSQQRAEAQRTADAGSWYNDYLNKVNQAKQDSAARDAQLVQQAQQRASSAQAQSQQGSEQTQQAAEADAAKRGAAVNPQLAQQENQASAARRSSAEQGTNFLDTLARNQSQHMTTFQTSAAKGGIEAKQTQQRRERKIAQQLLDQAREKGAFRTDFTRQLRDDLSKRQAEAAAFSLDSEKLSLDKQSKAFDQWLQKNKLSLDASQFDVTSGIQQQNANANTQRANKPSGGSKGPTQSQKQSNQNLWQNVLQFVKDNPKLKKIPTKKKVGLLLEGTRRDIPSYIKNNPRWFAAARHVYGKRKAGKKLNPGDIAFLKQKGLR